MRASRIWLLALLALLVPLCAQAHSPIKGVMPFYGGMAHPFVVPAHVMAMIALGLFIGQRATDRYGRLMLTLLSCVVLGSAAAAAVGDPDTDVPLLVITVLVAGAVAWARSWPAAVELVAVGLAGVLIGLGSAPDGVSGSARWLHLSGSCLGVLAGVAWMCIVAEHVKRPWQRIALRVVGSWIAASALLVVSLTAFGPSKSRIKPTATPVPQSAPASGAARSQS